MATRTAIVTGGGTGIGAAIARRLSTDGYAVTVLGRRTEPLDEVVEQLGEGLAVTGDVDRPDDCQALANDYGPEGVRANCVCPRLGEDADGRRRNGRARPRSWP